MLDELSALGIRTWFEPGENRRFDEHSGAGTIGKQTERTKGSRPKHWQACKLAKAACCIDRKTTALYGLSERGPALKVFWVCLRAGWALSRGKVGLAETKRSGLRNLTKKTGPEGAVAEMGGFFRFESWQGTSAIDAPLVRRRIRFKNEEAELSGGVERSCAVETDFETRSEEERFFACRSALMADPFSNSFHGRN